MPLKSESSTEKAPEVASLSQWDPIKRRFCRHKLALVSVSALSLLYAAAVFVEFVAPHSNEWQISRKTLYINLRNPFKNPLCPALTPWILRTVKTTPPYTYVRNPYSWMVDTRGNQLPYIDRIVFDRKGAGLIAVRAGEGEQELETDDAALACVVPLGPEATDLRLRRTSA